MIESHADGAISYLSVISNFDILILKFSKSETIKETRQKHISIVYEPIKINVLQQMLEIITINNSTPLSSHLMECMLALTPGIL